MTLNNKNNLHPHVHFINNNSSLVLALWKLGETSSITSLLLIRTSSTSGFRNGSVFTSSGSSLCSKRNDSGIIPYSLQHGIVRIVLLTSPD